MTDETNWVPVGGLPSAEGMHAVTVGTLRLALYQVDGSLFCTDNVCTHAFALLTDGWLEGTVIECPLHAGQFDIRTGCGMGPPIDKPIRTYAVRVEGDQVEIAITIGRGPA